MTTIVEMYRELAELTKAKKELSETYESQMKDFNNRINEIQTKINENKLSLDSEKIKLAETVIEKRGKYINGGEDKRSVINDVIMWFMNGFVTYNDGKTVNYYKDLRRHYFGTKSYDRWYGQRSDAEYGFGPSHGSIIFSIGLTSEYRRNDKPFTPEQIEAVIYYLHHIESIENARYEAA